VLLADEGRDGGKKGRWAVEGTGEKENEDEETSRHEERETERVGKDRMRDGLSSFAYLLHYLNNAKELFLYPTLSPPPAFFHPAPRMLMTTSFFAVLIIPILRLLERANGRKRLHRRFVVSLIELSGASAVIPRSTAESSGPEVLYLK